MLLRNHHRGDQRHQAKPQRSGRDATQGLYRPVRWEKGALSAPCHPCARQQPWAPTFRWLFARGCSSGRQPCLPAACEALRPEEAPRLRLGPALTRADAAEQSNGLVWFWALEGDWCWLLPGKLQPMLQGPKPLSATAGGRHFPSAGQRSSGTAACSLPRGVAEVLLICAGL